MMATRPVFSLLLVAAALAVIGDTSGAKVQLTGPVEETVSMMATGTGIAPVRVASTQHGHDMQGDTSSSSKQQCQAPAAKVKAAPWTPYPQPPRHPEDWIPRHCTTDVDCQPPGHWRCLGRPPKRCCYPLA